MGVTITYRCPTCSHLESEFAISETQAKGLMVCPFDDTEMKKVAILYDD